MKPRISKFWTPLLGFLFTIPFILTVMGSLAPYLPVSIFPMVQLIPPVLLGLGLVHIVFFILFVRRSFKWTLFAAVAIGLTVWVGSKEIRFSSPEATSSSAQIKVVSYNVAGFSFESDKVHKVSKILKEIDADVITLQEFRYHQLSQAHYALDQIAEAVDMPYYRFDHRPENLHGAATFSKYPILRVDTLFMERGEINTGILSTIGTPLGKMGVANIHLTSYRIGEKIREDKAWWPKVKSLFWHAQDVVKDQQHKVNQVLKKTKTYPYPLIIAGDLNSAPHSAIRQQFQNRFQDTFMEVGNGIGFSYPILGPYGLRIDYQFASQEWEIRSHEVFKADGSDHYPVVVCYGLMP